ncbi:hypothetical protein WJX74_008222 [Apatococcus lobatus]|uniref:Protein-S-isoprenylcysteine O-methyltransferase n=1 Tax=Apatococcus lobatus TaxID=904363 RepID=A0AAW1RI25_9CHLO
MLQLRLFFYGLAFFHVSEFVLAAAYSGRLSFASCLISPGYCLMLGLTMAENLWETSLENSWKAWWPCWPGILMIVCGEALRKSAMVTAGANFSHMICREAVHGRELVTHGLYRCRQHGHETSRISWLADMDNWHAAASGQSTLPRHCSACGLEVLAATSER